MKRILSAIALTSISSFAFDQYLPVAPKTLETDVMVSYEAGTGYFDLDGKKQDIDVSPSVITPAIQVKYGIMPGLDISLQAAFGIYNEDFGKKYNEETGEPEAASGLERPDIAIKYAHPELGAGAFVDVVLPFGSEDIVGDKVPTTIAGGLLYGKTFDAVTVNAFAAYVFNTEVEKAKQDGLSFYAQGQYQVNEMVGPYLGLQFDKAFEAKIDGESFPDSDGYLFTVKPGANVKINDAMAAEIAVPYDVMGKNAGATWGVYAGFYYSVGL